MRFLRIASSLGFFLLSGAAGAQQAPADFQNIENIANLMVRLCVGGGHVEALTGGGTGGADISLRSLDVKGHLAGEVTVSKSSAEGLVKGIDNAMNQVGRLRPTRCASAYNPFESVSLILCFPPQRPQRHPRPGPPLKAFSRVLLPIYSTQKKN
jgi:hypothetical protein